MQRTIKFDSKEFELINFTRASDRVSISLKKENNTVDSIADAADGNSKIQIWEDDGTNKVLTEEYKGFDERFFLSELPYVMVTYVREDVPQVAP